MDAGRQLANAAFPGASHRSLSQIAIPGVVCGYRSGHGRRAVTGVSHPDRKHHRERQPSRGREACYRPMRGRLACSATNSPPPALVPPACTAMAVYNQRHDLIDRPRRCCRHRRTGRTGRPAAVRPGPRPRNPRPRRSAASHARSSPAGPGTAAPNRGSSPPQGRPRTGLRRRPTGSRGEVRQGTEAGDPQRRPAQYPGLLVQVVAGLGEQHGSGQAGAAPVAPDVGVGLVPEPDRLQVLDGHDVTELPGLHDRLDRRRRPGPGPPPGRGGRTGCPASAAGSQPRGPPPKPPGPSQAGSAPTRRKCWPASAQMPPATVTRCAPICGPEQSAPNTRPTPAATNSTSYGPGPAPRPTSPPAGRHGAPGRPPSHNRAPPAPRRATTICNFPASFVLLR